MSTARNNIGFKTRKSRLAVLLITVLGAAVIWYTVLDTKNKMRHDLMQKAQIVANSINPARLKKLEGNLNDTNKIDYQRLNTQLYTIRKNYENCRFLYLMQQTDNNKVIFLVDAQTPSSPDYAKPGLVYEEISAPYLTVFRTGEPATVGPITDRWGKLITSLVPVKSPETGRRLAVLGMDVTINDWNLIVLRKLIPLLIIVLVTMLLVFYIQQVRLLRKDREAKEEIRKSRQQYKALFDHAADGILTSNLQGYISKANNSFCEITGYTENEISGKKIEILFSKDTLKKKPLAYGRILKGEIIREERELIRKDGQRIFVEMHSKRADEATLQSFIRDITRRKKNEQIIKEKNEELINAENELRASNKALRTINQQLEKQKAVLAEAKQKAEESDKLKSNFLANLSHEIRTPMNAIIGFSELILESEAIKDDENKTYLETIIKQGNHLLQLINDIVDLSKIEANQISINRHNVNVNEVIDDLFRTFKMNKLNIDKIMLQTEKALSDNESWIITDELRLKQIYTNLLSNALKFTREGTIIFGYKTDKTRIFRFFVADTGIGIPKEKQTKIFKRFHRLHDGHTSHYEGTGLGLSITKSLTELLGGTITIESEPEKGAYFEFTLKQD